MLACSTPGSVESHYNRGLTAYERGDLSEAVTEFELAVEKEPKNYRAWYNLGTAHHDQGALDPAEKAYRKVLEIQPKSGRAHVALADVWEKRGDPAKEWEHLLQAEAAEPDRAFPLALQGLAKERRGDPAAAEGLYRRAVAKEPTHVDSNYYLGRLLAAQGKVADGLQHLEKALKAAPDDVPSLMAAAEAYEALGRRSEAFDALQRAELRAELLEPETYLKMADLLEGMKLLEEAVSYVWKARDSRADPKIVEARLKHLYRELLKKVP